jgi:formylglycine-generating enzyme required for sulfatase activity
MRVVLAVALLPACYSATPAAGAPCDPDHPACPVGQMCIAVGGSYACEAGPVPFDARTDGGAPPDHPDARAVDAATIDASPSTMIAIAAGGFMMGCNTAVDSACDADESPYHMVTLSAYEIDATEVTQSQYAACVAATACTVPKNGMSCTYDPINLASYPVGCVDWSQATAYCAWAGKHLPTEAQWERAARGLDGRRYPWGNGNADCTLAAYSGCPGDTLPVGSHPTGNSPDGLADASGNVEEWVSDWYDSAYYASSPNTDPTGPSTGTEHVFRGGSYVGIDTYLRVSNRRFDVPATIGSGLGFRCAR